MWWWHLGLGLGIHNKYFDAGPAVSIHPPLSFSSTVALFRLVIPDPLGGAVGSTTQSNGPSVEGLIVTEQSFMTQMHPTCKHTPDESLWLCWPLKTFACHDREAVKDAGNLAIPIYTLTGGLHCISSLSFSACFLLNSTIPYGQHCQKSQAFAFKHGPIKQKEKSCGNKQS